MVWILSKVLVDLVDRIFEFLDEIIENNIEVDSDVAQNFQLFLKNGEERIEKFLFELNGLDQNREKAQFQMERVLIVLKKDWALVLLDFRPWLIVYDS